MEASRRNEGDGNQSQQPRRSKEVGNDQVAPHQPPPPPQKCPRCESLNTKFCYYNNYNFSQPRYFCKGCRRYWTHGGTLRNVPVGGGCRKGRRGRVSPISYSGESSRSPVIQQSQSQPAQQQLSSPPLQVDFPNIANMAALVSGLSNNLPTSSQQSLRTLSWAHPSITGSNYLGGGIFAGFDGMQMTPLSSLQTQVVNPPLRIGANMPIFPGFDLSSMKSQQVQVSQQLQIRDQPSQSDGIGNRNKDKQPMYTHDENMVFPAGNLNSWIPGDHNNTTNATTSNSNSNSDFWTNNNGTSNSTGPNEWPNIPDYGGADQ
ncbi:hypothetical protein ACH5RR_017931 [Cinchona calisaya]|uniref:Dof zinc finger protein n=1 Tax=Cinchona calisaya TaxID=153742 RepID=A0ABD2ZNP6_9GENT